MDKKKIMVTGASGQLGKCLCKLTTEKEWDYEFCFLNSTDLDITDEVELAAAVSKFRPDFVINAAAYTAVDLAEDEPEKAFAVNAVAVGNLAELCRKYKAVLIHISTDYVFDGETNISYSEDDFTAPTGIYGASKREGEILALEANKKTVIIRTSWLYSEFGKNFVKSMLRLFQEKSELGIVDDQYGQPTNANDLARFIFDIIQSTDLRYGIYHFSNTPETTWYKFACEIARITGSHINLKPISTDMYPSKAKRPKRSTLDLFKAEEKIGLEPRDWRESLAECLEEIQELKADL